MAKVELKKVMKIYENGFTAVNEMDLEINDGEFMVFVGPSGSAKSTILRMIAGLEAITSGEIYIDNTLINNIAPKDRKIAMVFQNYALYPHMTVYDNMTFGLKLKQIPKEEIDNHVKEVAKKLEITNLLCRKPKEMSGGQCQRVALGRAIIRKPDVFLFDEPLSNLDAKLRVSMRVKISQLHKELGTTMLYVTHDQVEAMTMGDRICVLNAGEIMQIGPPLDIYNHPVNKFVAGFIGSPMMNFLDGEIEEFKNNLFVVINGKSFSVPNSKKECIKKYIGKKIIFGIRPEHIVYGTEEEENTITGNVLVCEEMGYEEIIYFDFVGNQMIARVKSSKQEKINQNKNVIFKIDMEHCHFFDPETEIRL